MKTAQIYSSDHAGNAPDLSLQHLNIIIPDGVTYDGVQESPRGRLLCFTVLSVGASFSIREEEASSVKVARLAGGLRSTFGGQATI